MALQQAINRIRTMPSYRLLRLSRAVAAEPSLVSLIARVSTSIPGAGTYRHVSTSSGALSREPSDAGRHVGRKGQFWDLKHDPDADWKPKDDESDYEYAVFPDEHEHVSWATWLRWLLITLLQSAGALALVGGVSSTVVSHGVAKSQVLSGAKETMHTTLEQIEEFDLFIETMVELSALIDAGLGTSPGQWAPPAVSGANAGATTQASGADDTPDSATTSAQGDDAAAPPPSSPSGGGARPRTWDSNRGAEWLRRRSELYTLRFDKLGPMMREMGDLRERGVAPLATVLDNPWAYVQLVALAAHEDELYSSLHQCDMSTHRLGEWKSDVVAWVEGMSVENLPALLAQAQEAVRARHMGEANAR